MTRQQQNASTYQKRRQKEYASDTAPVKQRFPRRREITSKMKPLEFFHTSEREWIDTPEDRAAVALILKGGAK